MSSTASVVRVARSSFSSSQATKTKYMKSIIAKLREEVVKYLETI